MLVLGLMKKLDKSDSPFKKLFMSTLNGLLKNKRTPPERKG